MTLFLLSLAILVGLWIIGGIFAHRITSWLGRYWPAFAYEGEGLLLWGGLLLSGFGIGLLVMYLLLEP